MQYIWTGTVLTVGRKASSTALELNVTLKAVKSVTTMSAATWQTNGKPRLHATMVQPRTRMMEEVVFTTWTDKQSIAEQDMQFPTTDWREIMVMETNTDTDIAAVKSISRHSQIQELFYKH